MLLCPNQSSRLAADLVPALMCASRAAEYDWCSLVLKKLMESVAMFARRFYASGVASGCAGCLILIVVMYLDRLNRHPVQWGYFPRMEVWNMEEIRMAIREDRFLDGGDFGQLGEARDTNGPDGTSKVERLGSGSVCYRTTGARKRIPKWWYLILLSSKVYHPTLISTAMSS
ncbi:uncharacterized protein LOC110726193 isoform X2 [Chenopodium quinoa]|uniref:uncharacterized protein LOC110726193 isoform X2 n=1 Tax=Chenopodium quinoa TaxID=63459 RepID=UPI000B771069|nr:uncharacterized protein LOC110726193 isoform X2 [Chenopodium quinoa]